MAKGTRENMTEIRVLQRKWVVVSALLLPMELLANLKEPMLLATTARLIMVLRAKEMHDGIVVVET